MMLAMKDWSVSWEGVWIGYAKAESAAEAILLMRARYPQMEAGEWKAVEIPPSEG
jgi:hypothetical protein